MMTTDRPALAAYRTEVSRCARLSPEAERALALRARGGDRLASRRLVEGCLPGVMTIARKYRCCGLPLDDLVQEGNVGLLKALDRFDPDRGMRLLTYAAYWVRAEIREYVARHYRLVRLGASKAERRALWLYRRTREDRPEALASMSGLSVDQAAALLPFLIWPEASLSPPGDGPDPGERLADGRGSAEAELATRQARARVNDVTATVLSQLSARDSDIARRRLLADEPATLEQLGETWGVSRERVRQLEQNIKARMRRELAEVMEEAG